jgi:hypothetical protein
MELSAAGDGEQDPGSGLHRGGGESAGGSTQAAEAGGEQMERLDKVPAKCTGNRLREQQV